MNYVTLIIAVGFLLCFLIYQIIKNHLVENINKLMEKRQYKELRALTEKSIYQKLLGSFVCDLYVLRSYLHQNEDKAFKEYLLEVLQKPYSLAQRKEVLDIYYYHFIFQGDAAWSAKLLDYIRETNDLKYIRFHKEAYAVMIEKRTDLLDRMIDGIDHKQYSGLGLGIAVFMIGMQYLLLKDKENARIYFYNSLSCFHKQSFYYAQAQMYVKQLSEELDEAIPEY